MVMDSKLVANVDNMKWLGFGATNLSHATELTSSELANKPTDTQLFYIMCYVVLIIMTKRKYEVSKTIDYQMLDPKEILGKKIVDIYLHTDTDGDELQILLEGGKQIEICLLDCGKVHVQSD